MGTLAAAKAKTDELGRWAELSGEILSKRTFGEDGPDLNTSLADLEQLLGPLLEQFAAGFLRGSISQQAERLGIETFEMLNREISKIPPGSDGLLFLPFFSGAILPEWNPDARGVFLGLTLKHTRIHLARSIMEGTAYVLRDMVRHLSEIGLDPTRIILAGGGARSLVWQQIKTDATNRRTVRCVNEEVTALGAAIISAVGCGSYNDIEEAIKKTVALSSDLIPSPSSSEAYGRLYSIYREAYEALKPAFSKIAMFQEN